MLLNLTTCFIFFRSGTKAFPMETKSRWSVQILPGCDFKNQLFIPGDNIFTFGFVCKVELGLGKEALCRQIKKNPPYFCPSIR